VSEGWNYSLEAEQSVLGGLLLDNSAFDRIADLLQEVDFFASDHRVIFRAIFELIESGKPADALTVFEWVSRSGYADRGSDRLDRAYIGDLAFNTASVANIRRYAEIVRERSILRGLFGAASNIIESVRETKGREVRELLDRAQASVMAISEKNQGDRSEFTDTTALLTQTMEFIDTQFQRAREGELSDVTGLTTGFIDLDRMLTGLHGGQLVVLAARPSMGKSAFALNIGEAGAQSSQKTAAIFSMEMSRHELGLRLLAAGAQVNMQRLATGRINDQEWPRITAAVGRLNDLPMLINETGALTVMELRAMARRAFRDAGGLSVIIVDYLQLMSGSDQRANQATQIAEITRGLKQLAKELQVPVIALSQLNRELERRPNKRPIMSDLRESGAIEQDADVILFIYRDEVYHSDSTDRGIAEIIIAKQRNGPTGTVRLNFRADHTRFLNLANEY